MCILRSSPLSLPRSHLLLAIAILINIAFVSEVAKSLAPLVGEEHLPEHFTTLTMLLAIGHGVFEIAVEVILICLLLRFRNQQARTYSTVFALLGTQVLLVLASVLVLALFAYLPALLLYPSAIETKGIGIHLNMNDLGPFTWFLLPFTFAFLVWFILVYSRILSISMEISRGMAAFFTVVIAILGSLLTSFSITLNYG